MRRLIWRARADGRSHRDRDRRNRRSRSRSRSRRRRRSRSRSLRGRTVPISTPPSVVKAREHIAASEAAELAKSREKVKRHERKAHERAYS